jgi:hypothetical protein
MKRSVAVGIMVIAAAALSGVAAATAWGGELESHPCALAAVDNKPASGTTGFSPC